MVRTTRKTRKTVAPAPKHVLLTETKHDKFLRLGQARINRVLTTLRLVGNLASYNYEFNEADIATMKQSLTVAVEATLAKFQTKKPPAPSFKFLGREAH